VRTALANLFPDLRISRDDDVIEGETGSLERLKELIRNQRIRDTARKQLLAARRGSPRRREAVRNVVSYNPRTTENVKGSEKPG